MRTLGVSWQKTATMAKNFGKSEPTIKRYLSKLKKLGIIERVKPIKGSHFITYFSDQVELANLPSETASDTPKMIHLENDETATESKAEDTKSTKEARTFKAKSKAKLSYKERYKGESAMQNDTVEINQSKPKTQKRLDDTFVPNWVASEFVESVKPFFDDANTITKLWTKAAYAARKLDLCGKNDGPNMHVQIVIDAFKTTIYDYKRNKIKGSLFGYYYGVVKNKLKDHKDENELIFASVSSVKEDSLYFDWLNS
jgi:hypothetical protein